MGTTTLVHHKMEVPDSKPTSNPSYNKVRIVRVEEVDLCTAFVGEVPVKKICGLIKVFDGSCNNYNTNKGKEKVYLESAFYLTSNGTNLFLKPLVSLTIGYSNQEFISLVREDISKETAMDILDEVKLTVNTATEGFEKAAYVGMIETPSKEVIDELVCGDPGSSAKRLKTFLPSEVENIANLVMELFFQATVTFETLCRSDCFIPCKYLLDK